MTPQIAPDGVGDSSNLDSEFAKLYPELSPEELHEARYNLERYFDVALSVAKEIAKKQP